MYKLYNCGYSYNHLLIVKPWKSFVRGQIIWANHMGGMRYYSLPRRAADGIYYDVPLPQKCAINLEGTFWQFKGTIYKIIKYQANNADGSYCSELIVRSYLADYRTKDINILEDDRREWVARFIKEAIWMPTD